MPVLDPGPVSRLWALGPRHHILEQIAKDENADQGLQDHDKNLVYVMVFFSPPTGNFFVFPTSGGRECHARTFLVRTVKGMVDEGGSGGARSNS